MQQAGYVVISFDCVVGIRYVIAFDLIVIITRK